MGRNEDVKSELVSLELRAMARLLSAWSDAVQPSHHAIWRKRLPRLREDLLIGLRAQKTPGPLSELVPHEIVADEYRTLLPCITHLKKQAAQSPNRIGDLLATDVPTDVKVDGIVFRRPMFVGRTDLPPFRKLLTSKSKPSEICHEVVAMRHAIGRKTVKNAISKNDRQEARTPALMLLASLTVDLGCSRHPLAGHEMSLLTQALDALANSSYPCIMTYYLVQLMHSSRFDVCVRRPNQTELMSLISTTTQLRK